MLAVNQVLLAMRLCGEGCLKTENLCFAYCCGLIQVFNAVWVCWWQTFGCASCRQTIQTFVEATMRIAAYQIQAARERLLWSH